MSKLKDLSAYELKVHRDKYRAQLDGDPSDQEAKAKLEAIEIELVKRKSDSTGVTQTQTQTQSLQHNSSEIVPEESSEGFLKKILKKLF